MVVRHHAGEFDTSGAIILLVPLAGSSQRRHSEPCDEARAQRTSSRTRWGTTDKRGDPRTRSGESASIGRTTAKRASVMRTAGSHAIQPPGGSSCAATMAGDRQGHWRVPRLTGASHPAPEARLRGLAGEHALADGRRRRRKTESSDDRGVSSDLSRRHSPQARRMHDVKVQRYNRIGRLARRGDKPGTLPGWRHTIARGVARGRP
jgi:hypothetical protein